MNGDSTPKKMCGSACWSVLFLILLMVFGILLLVQTIQIESINKRIDDIYHGRISCVQACGNDYIQSGQNCCLYYNKGICRQKKVCSTDQIENYTTQQNDAIEKVWIYSFLTLIMLMGLCWHIRRGCKDARRGIAVQEAVYHGINESQNHSNHDQKGKRIDTAYQSFAYQDDQSTCCICLEEFKNEKAILLKCGPIFHSLCIRDWAVKQENCPICRSIQ